jgi:hypothetical protein
MRLQRAESLDVSGDAFEMIVLRILDDEVERVRRRLPPPGESVFAHEVEQLRNDVRSFVVMVREDAATRTFSRFEYRFGRDKPAPVTLPDGSVLYLTGAIDRVDEEGDALVIVDYKTGGTYDYGVKNGLYHGGRRLQHVLYARAAEALLGKRVTRFEYHFPSRKAENHRARFELTDLGEGLVVVTDLIEMAARGSFLPTNQADDCRFCDYAAACRVVTDDFGKVTSPLSEWSRDAPDPALDVMRRLRR